MPLSSEDILKAATKVEVQDSIILCLIFFILPASLLSFFKRNLSGSVIK